jgi:hypothetical protein
MAHLETVVAAGGEGLMLHHDDSAYRAGRSDDLHQGQSLSGRRGASDRPLYPVRASTKE